MHVNPETEAVDEDELKNTAVRIFVGNGNLVNSEGVRLFDVELVSGAATFEEAIIGLANSMLDADNEKGA